MTAVEWFRRELIINSINKEDKKGRCTFVLGLNMLDELSDQAKEMEKEQVIDAYLKDIEKVTIDKVLVHLDKAEEYYETIKTRTNDSKTTI